MTSAQECKVNKVPGISEDAPSAVGSSEQLESSSEQQHSLQHQQQQQLQEPVDPNACIILHPGSRFLRLGRPSDSIPYTVLHAIARRQKNTSDAKKRMDPFIVPMAKMVCG